MSAWFSQHLQAVRGAFVKLGAQRAASLLNMLVIGIAISLPLAGYVLLGNLQGIAARFSLEPQLSIFMAGGAKPADRDALEKLLKADSRVGAVRCVLLAAVVRVGDVQVDWARLLRVLIVDSSLEVTCS